MIVLLAVIFLAFIGLGLPDTVIGSIWPVIQKETSSSVYGAGVITLIVQCGTVLSSLFASRLVQKFSTRIVTFASILLTSFALMLYASSSNIIFLFFAAVPLGLGAGCVDAALNGYVANHFKSNVMNFLHGFWGIGAFSGPFIMSMMIHNNMSWRTGFIIIAVILLIIAVFVLSSKKYWLKEDYIVNNTKHISSKNILKEPLVKPTLISFSFFSYIELTTGLWISSYLVYSFGVNPAQAALITAFYYGSITAGRIVTGIFSNNFQNYQLIRAGEIIVILGCLLMMIDSLYIKTAGIIITGLGSSPIYPAMLHNTPKIFGSEKSLTMMGMQMAVTYTGGALAPLLFGFLAGRTTFFILPFFILFGAVIMLISSEYLNYRIKGCNIK